jgi:hypothetical protein
LKKGVFMEIKRSLGSKLVLLAIAGFLALSSCENPWMKALLKDKKEPDTHGHAR